MFVSMCFCGVLQVLHYTTEITVQTVLFVQLNSNTLFHMPVIRFSSLRWDMAVQELMCGQAPLPCAQLALFPSYAPLISPTMLGSHYACK